MIFKMRRYYAALGIVRRMLHRAKVGNVHVLRYDNKAAGVLACCALNADKALGKAVFLDLCDLDPTLLEIFFYIAVGRFSARVPIVPARKTWSEPKSSSVYLCACA